MFLELKSSAWFFKVTRFFESGHRRKLETFNRIMTDADRGG